MQRSTNMTLLYSEDFVDDVLQGKAHPKSELRSVSRARRIIRMFDYEHLFDATSIHDVSLSPSNPITMIDLSDMSKRQPSCRATGELEFAGFKYVASAWRFHKSGWQACEFMRAHLVMDKFPPTFLCRYLTAYLASLVDDMKGEDWDIEKEGLVLRRVEAQVHSKIINPDMFSLLDHCEMIASREGQTVVHLNLLELERCSVALRDFGWVNIPQYLGFPLESINSWRFALPEKWGCEHANQT